MEPWIAIGIDLGTGQWAEASTFWQTASGVAVSHLRSASHEGSAPLRVVSAREPAVECGIAFADTTIGKVRMRGREPLTHVRGARYEGPISTVHGVGEA